MRIINKFSHAVSSTCKRSFTCNFLICRIQVDHTDYTMASTENSTETNYEAWIQKCPNFTLVTGSGEELKCHKSFLAMHSPVFETMINSEFKEAKSDTADIKYFDTLGSILPSATSNLCKLSRLRTKKRFSI